jgi:hypothetical protein
MKVFYTIIALKLLLFNASYSQEKSFLKIEPEIGKDTLEIINIDSLKFDINVSYMDDEVSSIYFTGKIGLVNKYKLNIPGTLWILYTGSEKRLKIDFKGKEELRESTISQPNYIDYKVSNFINSFMEPRKQQFSVQQTKGLISKIIFNRILMFDSFKYIIIDHTRNVILIKHILISFSQRDVNYVNVYNKNGELMLKIPYRELLSFPIK